MKAGNRLSKFQEWLALRPKVNPASIAKALDILDRPTIHGPEEEDQLPKGYVLVRRKYAGKE
jgi:hypothetical protein